MEELEGDLRKPRKGRGLQGTGRGGQEATGGLESSPGLGFG